MHLAKLLCVVQDEEQPKAKDAHDVSCEREQEQEEVAVVPPSYTVVHPRAVVIKILQNEMEHWRKGVWIFCHLLSEYSAGDKQTWAYRYGESPEMTAISTCSSNDISTWTVWQKNDFAQSDLLKMVRVQSIKTIQMGWLYNIHIKFNRS